MGAIRTDEKRKGVEPAPFGFFCAGGGRLGIDMHEQSIAKRIQRLLHEGYTIEAILSALKKAGPSNG